MLLQGFHGGIANHDVLVGKNQVAYAENVFLRDPEFISLGQKSENYALTDSDLVLSKLDRADYFGTVGGKIYTDGANNIVGSLGAYPIINLFISAGTTVYLWMQRGVFSLARIDWIEVPGQSGWVSGDIESQASYNATAKTGSQEMPTKYIKISNSSFLITDENKLKQGDGNLTYTNLPNLGFAGVGLWRTINYIKILEERGNLQFTDGANNVLNATQDMSGRYIEGIYGNNIEMIIAGYNKDNTVIFVPSGEGKQMIARSHLSGPDQKKVHYYGRESYIGVGTAEINKRQYGNDTYCNYNNVTYMINEGALMSYGSIIPGLSNSRNIETVSNYNDDAITEIGMLRVDNFTDSNRLYYSWKNGAGECGVDRIDLDKINNPDTYRGRGEVHTQKFDFGDNKVYINKVKIRAYTTAGQTIKVYSSVDGGAFTLKQTLNQTDPKKYFLLDSNEECYTIQWKFVLETNDETKTPKIYAFSFNPKVGNNE